MKHRISALTLLVLLFSFVSAWAQSFPTVSTDGNAVYYLIRFMNGGNAFTATTNNAQISTSAATASDAQLWKIEGNDAEGYTFTNKLGLRLCATSSAKNTMVKASSSASGTTRFKIVKTTNSTYSGNYEIQPVGNSAVSMNLWGGPAENRGVGFGTRAIRTTPCVSKAKRNLIAWAASHLCLIPPT